MVRYSPQLLTAARTAQPDPGEIDRAVLAALETAVVWADWTAILWAFVFFAIAIAERHHITLYAVQ